MKKQWRKFATLVAASHAEMSEYRVEIVLWILSSIMPFMLMGLWMNASQTGNLGMGPVGFARYFLAVFVVRQVTLVWVIYEFEEDVVKGRLSAHLLHPIDPGWRYLASHLGERMARFPFLVGICAIFFMLYPPALWIPSPTAAGKALFALSAAFALRFLMQYAFAMVAFWSERANAIEDLWFFMYLFLSGFIAPLELFPPTVRRLAELTPFPYLVYMPAQILIGRPVDLGRGMSVMAVWGIAFWILYRLLWKAGLKRYSAMGA